MANRPLIRALPKAELHLHLEGTVDPETLVLLSQRHDAVSLHLEQAQKIYAYSGLPGFLMAFKAVTERLLDAEDFELVTYQMMKRLYAERVLHAEVYISVGVVHWRNHEFEPLFEGIERGRARGQRDFGISVSWIFDAVRHFGIEPARRGFELAVQHRDRGVVAIGIGGDEDYAPPPTVKEVYRYGPRHRLARARPVRRCACPPATLT